VSLNELPFAFDFKLLPYFRFQLPGGPLKLNDDEEINLPIIDGDLQAWGILTAALADTLGTLKPNFYYFQQVFIVFISQMSCKTAKVAEACVNPRNC
jgi:hypothetical protein